MNIEILKDPAKRAEFVFGQPMKACPRCGGYHLGYSTPIKLNEPLTDNPRQILGAWARARKGGETPLEGTACIMCRDCFYMGPKWDVAGRTAEDVGRDPLVASVVKDLWNSESNRVEKIAEETK